MNKTLFPSLNHARATLAAWRMDYNTERPYSRLGYQRLQLMAFGFPINIG